MNAFLAVHALAASLGLGPTGPAALPADTLVRPWVQMRHLPPSHIAPAPFPSDSVRPPTPARLHVQHRRDRDHNAVRPGPRTPPGRRLFITPSATR